MKKILSGMIAIAVAFSAVAQDGQKAEGNIQNESRHHKHQFGENSRRSEKMSQNLNLSEDQKSRMNTLNETFSKQMKELNQNENITVKEQKDRRQALVSQHKSQVDAILTPEQRSKMQALKTHSAYGKGKQRGIAKGNRTHMMKNLNLTDEQQKSFKTINEDFKAKMQGIQNNSGLTDVQKKDQIKSLNKQHAGEIRSLLTPEQKDKLKESRKNRHHNKTV